MNLTAAFAAALLALASLADLAEAAKVDGDCRFYFTWCGSGFKVDRLCSQAPTPGMRFCGSTNCLVATSNCFRMNFVDRVCVAECCAVKKYYREPWSPYPGMVMGQTGFRTEAPFAGNYTGDDVVRFVDTDQDGKLDENEVKIFAERHGLPDDNFWRALDADGDNHLTANEIDPKLASK